MLDNVCMAIGRGIAMFPAFAADCLASLPHGVPEI